MIRMGHWQQLKWFDQNIHLRGRYLCMESQLHHIEEAMESIKCMNFREIWYLTGNQLSSLVWSSQSEWDCRKSHLKNYWECKDHVDTHCNPLAWMSITWSLAMYNWLYCLPVECITKARQWSLTSWAILRSQSWCNSIERAKVWGCPDLCFQDKKKISKWEPRVDRVNLLDFHMCM